MRLDGSKSNGIAAIVAVTIIRDVLGAGISMLRAVQLNRRGAAWMTAKCKGVALGLSICMLPFIGCATVVSGRDATVAITSSPPNAQVAVRDQTGEVVATGVTPMKVALDRSRGLLKKPPRYTATIQKPGYGSKQVSIDPKLNPWLAGNVVLGGPIGVLADSATGAMWNLKPNKIDQKLPPLNDAMYGYEESETTGSHKSRMARQSPSPDVQQVTYASDE